GPARSGPHAWRRAAGAPPGGAPAGPAGGLRVRPAALRPGGGRARGLLVRATRLGLRVRRAVRALLGSCGRALCVAPAAMARPLRSVSRWGLPVPRWLRELGSFAAPVFGSRSRGTVLAGGVRHIRAD